MKKIIALVLAIVLLIAVRAALAYTCNASGCTFEFTYTEPTTLTNGQPLSDLVNCTISWSKAVDVAAAVAQAPVSVPASRPQGGTAIVKVITDPTALPNHVYAVQATGATCTSTAFGTSAPSAAGNVLPMNNGVASSPPAGVTAR